MERIRLVGIARGGAQRSGAVLVQRTVVADDQGAFGRIDVLDPFDIELEDGTVLRVDPETEARLEPVRETKVPWADIEDDPSFAPLREKGPAPHVMVVVKRRAVRDGERVALLGDEKDFSFEGEDAAGMRTAPTKKLSAVSAEILAVGDDAENILAKALESPPSASKTNEKNKKKKKKEKHRRKKAKHVFGATWGARVVLGIAVVLFALVSLLRTSPIKLDLGCIALSLVALSAAIGYRGSLPRFVREQKTVEDNIRSFTALAIAAPLGLLAFMGFVLISDSAHANATPPSNGSTAVVIVLASWQVALVVILHWFTKKTAALVSVLAKAAPFEEDFRDHAWGSAVGVVRDPTPVNYEGDVHAVAHVVDVRVQSGSDPDIVVEKVINEGTFLVDTRHGRSFELHPKDATWASSVRRLVHKDESHEKSAYVVPLGGSIVVAGRAARPTKKAKTARFAKSGQDGLLFYATAADKDAHAEIRWFAARRVVAFAVIVACAGTMIGWAVLVAPQLPAFHVEGGDD